MMERTHRAWYDGVREPGSGGLPGKVKKEHGVTGRPLPSGEVVGWQVVDELVIELRQQRARFVVETAVAGAGRVAGEGAAAHRRRPEVVEATSLEAGGVAGEGAVAHRGA